HPRHVQLLPFHYLFAFALPKVGNAEVKIGTLNSAVHLENLSGDVAGCGGGGEDHRGRDLPGVADPAKRVACSICRRSASSVSTMSSAEVAAAPTAIARCPPSLAPRPPPPPPSSATTPP